MNCSNENNEKVGFESAKMGHNDGRETKQKHGFFKYVSIFLVFDLSSLEKSMLSLWFCIRRENIRVSCSQKASLNEADIEIIDFQYEIQNFLTINSLLIIRFFGTAYSNEGVPIVIEYATNGLVNKY